MARTRVDIAASLVDAWIALQQLSTWEGVAGIHDLHSPRHDTDGNLAAFGFAMDTALGRVNGHARSRPVMPKMVIQAEQKGLQITLQVVLVVNSDRTWADVEARSRATSFLNKPLELTLNSVLETSIDGEAAKIASRIG